MAVEATIIDGRQVWRKTYRDSPRRLALAALAAIVLLLGLSPLRPPPRHPAPHARQLESRRLRQLREHDVRTPEIVAEGEGWLALSDLGPTLAMRLREAVDDPANIDMLARQAVQAISDAHARGMYFGQPLPRNLLVTDDGIGFIDFEEDPLEVMTLPQAQARDWLLFAHGIARYYEHRPQALAGLLDAGLRNAHGEVSASVRMVGRRLRPLARLAHRFGRSARVFAHAVFALG